MSLNSSLLLTNQAATVSVNLALSNPDFSLTINNPLIDFSTPTDDIAYNAAPTFNIYAINIGFLTNGVTLTFKESGGLGSILNATRSTVFEKLFYLSFFDKTYKKFYLNDTNYIPVSITAYRVHVGPGMKDLVEHTLTLMITNSEGT
jgi:hypothetical protein